MKKFMLATCFCILFSAAALADDAKDMTTLDISAEAHAKAAPDIATISTGVVTISPKADQALAQNTVKMNALFKALKEAGIAEKDIQTSGFSLAPQYDYKSGAPVIQSYQASNNVTVIMHDLKTIGPVLDSVVAQGSNQINGPSFTVENSDALLDQSRQEAVAKARARAELYAKAAGLKIKRILSISEQQMYNPGPQPMMMRAMAAEGGMQGVPTPVAAGEVNLGVTVNIRFELAQ